MNKAHPWLKQFRYNPLKPLLETKSEAITYFVEQDLLDENPRWFLAWLIAHQKSDKFWKVPYSRIHKQPDEIQTRDMQLCLTLNICRIFKRVG